MKYLGGKARIGKEIANIINSVPNAKVYHEPFCGMYSVGRHVTIEKRSGADIPLDLIALLKAIQTGWQGPDNVSECEYMILKESRTSAIRAFAGFGCSFSGKFFGGYARDKTRRNFAKNAANSLKKLAPHIHDVYFFQQDYRDFDSDRADVIYCDPPYDGTTDFSTGRFNTKEFWDWARDMSSKAVVFVSEYNAPGGFVTVWQKQVKTDMNSKTGQKLDRIEKLFRCT